MTDLFRLDGTVAVIQVDAGVSTLSR